MIPYTTDRAGYSLVFNIHVDGVLRGSYPYHIRKPGVGSILVLPFFWINLYTDSQEEAIRQASYHFIRSARYEVPLRLGSPLMETK